jgi:hypothetical protein
MDDFVEDLKPLLAQHPDVIILATITSAKCVADWFAGGVSYYCHVLILHLTA